jgi:hypothetical protein
MIKRIVIAGLVVFLAMVAIKNGRVLHATGLTGSCSVVQTGADGSTLDACSSGKLEGFPSLSGHGCTNAGNAGTYEYWRCPASLAGDQATR